MLTISLLSHAFFISSFTLLLQLHLHLHLHFHFTLSHLLLVLLRKSQKFFLALNCLHVRTISNKSHSSRSSFDYLCHLILSFFFFCFFLLLFFIIFFFPSFFVPSFPFSLSFSSLSLFFSSFLFYGDAYVPFDALAFHYAGHFRVSRFAVGHSEASDRESTITLRFPSPLLHIYATFHFHFPTTQFGCCAICLNDILSAFLKPN